MYAQILTITVCDMIVPQILTNALVLMTVNRDVPILNSLMCAAVILDLCWTAMNETVVVRECPIHRIGV